MFKQLVAHLLGRRTALQLDDDAHACAITFVTQVANLIQLAFAHELGNPFNQHRFVDLIGDFGHDNAEAIAPVFFNFSLGANQDLASPGGKGLFNAFGAQDNAAGREVRPFDKGHQLFQADLFARLPAVDDVDDRISNFAEIMRRNVGGHPDGDAAGAVDQEIGQHGRQHLGFFQAVVKVRVPVHRIHFDVLEHRIGNPRQAGFGIPHGRRTIAIDRTEVALAID